MHFLVSATCINKMRCMQNFHIQRCRVVVKKQNGSCTRRLPFQGGRVVGLAHHDFLAAEGHAFAVEALHEDDARGDVLEGDLGAAG
jgi:hypothetical protein